MIEFIKTIFLDFWNTVTEMSPYLLFGFFMAGVLSIFVTQQIVQRHLGGRGFIPLLKASIFGVPLPLCSCGVIPVSMSLHKHGASKGSTISFLISTPQTGVDSIFVTLSLLGPIFAVFRPIVALISGLLGGAAVDVFGKNNEQTGDISPPCEDDCCKPGPISARLTNGMKYAFVTLPRDIGKALLLGLLVAAIISASVPDGFFAEHLGTGIFSKVVMMILGIPVYVCATASVPVAAALILKGLTPGAAFVFLMTGPATNAAGFITIWKTLGRRVAIIYITSVAGCALLFGILLDQIIGHIDVEFAPGMGGMLPDYIRYLSAFVLMGILVWPIIKSVDHKK
jgi:uncharacterized membrane protein YraQ (UPF0718 family)